MKHFWIIVAIAILSIPVCRANASLDTLWNNANTAYINGDYEGAIAGYDSVLLEGYSGYKLYYNLGNAYFKSGQIGKSILNYNRALRLAPSDEDVKHNLSVANSYVKDKIERVPEFFLKTWFKSLRVSMSTNSWAVASLVLLALVFAAVLFYLLSGKMVLRKAGFYTAIVSFVLFIFAVVFSVQERSELLHSTEAVVMSSAAPVKSSPDNSSKDIFILHEGTKVRVLSTLNQWCEIAIPDGNKGWIMESSIEKI